MEEGVYKEEWLTVILELASLPTSSSQLTGLVL